MTKRDAICTAALELFAEKGIEATTTREIAERAGAAEGTLYRHFEGKDDLAGWLYERCTRELHDRLSGAVEGLSDPNERLEALVRGVFDFFATQPTSCTYLLSARRGDVANGRDGEEGGPPRDLFVEALEEGRKQGVFRDDSARLVAGWILALVQRTVLFLKAGTLNMTEEEAIDRTVDAALRLVAGDIA